MQNLKIAINEEQPLDEVVKELERLGYKKDYVSFNPVRVVITWGGIGIYDQESIDDADMTDHPTYTTLTELRSMS